MKRINLIPQARWLARQRRLRCRIWCMVGGVYTALLVTVCFSVWGTGSDIDIRAVSDDLTQLDSELTELEATREGLVPELAERRLILSSSKSITDQPDWSVLLRYLANDLLSDDVVLRGCLLAPVGGASVVSEPADTPLTLTLKGYAKSTPAASRFVLRLEGSGLFDRVTLIRTSMEPFMDGQAIAFEVRCLLGEEGGGSR